MAADLNDPAARQAVFAKLGAGAGLAITEGLLMYLPAETVEELAVEMRSTRGVRHWLLDLSSKHLTRNIGLDTFQAMQAVRATNHLDGVGILEVLQRSGWTSSAMRSYTQDAWEVASGRIQAMMDKHPEAKEMPPAPAGDPSGVHLFTRD